MKRAHRFRDLEDGGERRPLAGQLKERSHKVESMIHDELRRHPNLAHAL
ncbi:MAG TPA: hypothetical protein VJ521_15075 [Acidobacteriota bacterium]|nr:hypothetical protein [Acidobacteriota bacterium]